MARSYLLAFAFLGGCTTETAVGLERNDSGVEVRTCPFAIDDTLAAEVRATADDSYTLFLNAAQISKEPHVWYAPDTIAVKVFRHPTRANVIAVDARNEDSVDGSVDRGVLVDLGYAIGTTQHHVISDESFKVLGGSAAIGDAWKGPSFDDGAWAAAVPQVIYNAYPYGPDFGIAWGLSTATWIWSYDSAKVPPPKLRVEALRLRRLFYVGNDGAPRSTPEPCP